MDLVPSTPRRRGRPRKEDCLVIQVRLTMSIYDAYIKAALKAQVPVRSVMRHVLEKHAPG